jgi:methyl-accepting chemotaxis protein
MLRKLKISGRLALIIAILIAFITGIILSFFYGFNNVKNLSVDKAQNIMFNGQKEKVELIVKGIGTALESAIENENDTEKQKDIMRAAVEQFRFEKDKSGYIFIYEGTKNVAMPTNKSLIGQDLGNKQDVNGKYFIRELRDVSVSGGGFVEYVFPKPGKGDQPKISYAQMIKGSNCWLGTGVYLDNIEEEKAVINSEITSVVNRILRNLAIFVIVILGVVVIPINLAIRQSIVKPLAEAIAVTKKVAEGDLNVEIDTSFNDELSELMKALKQMTDQLKDIIENIVLGSNNIAAASQELSSSSQQMSQGASEQATSVEQVSSSMEEMVANIQQNTSNSQETEKIASKASVSIQDGNESVTIAVQTMNDVADKIKIINDIAFQTNILALNAAVEAARAGEHGKGFAVVASEVRKLAERSKVAADEIEVFTKDGVDVSIKAGEQLSDLVPEIEKTAKLVQEIAAASIEQNSGADQINNAVQQMNQVTQQNAATSEEIASSSEELASQAMQLKEIVSFFNK